MKMKWSESRFDSGLGRARGLGSAGSSAVHHWLHQRISAVANLILTVWLISFIIPLAQKLISPPLVGTYKGEECQTPVPYVCSGFQWAYDTAVHALSSGLNPVFALLFVVSVFYHAKLGLQVVIEDYIPHEGAKIAALLGLKLVLGFMAVICLFSILKVTL